MMGLRPIMQPPIACACTANVRAGYTPLPIRMHDGCRVLKLLRVPRVYVQVRT
jgi:hypothetical protein